MSKEWESFSEVGIDVPSTESVAMISSQEQGDFGQDDTSALLPGAPDSKAKNQLPSIFSLEFYRKCWDVTTNEVRLRVKSACYPRGDFISGLHGKPDLYGPFWVSVTLCFSTAICGNLANFIQNQGNPEYKYTPEFERVTSAASAIFGYAFIFPFFISLVLYYSKIMCGFSTVELLTSYGYSLSIFIPISFACMIPFEFIRWTLVIIGAVISGSVVCLPIWQGLKEVMSNKKIAYAILTIAVAANVALAVGFKMYFFNAPLQSHDGQPINSSQPSLADQVIAEQAIAKDVAPAEPIAPEDQPPAEPEAPPQAEAQVSKDVEEVAEEPEEIKEETAEDRPERDEANAEEPVPAEDIKPVPEVEEPAPEVPESDQAISEEDQKVIEVLKELPRDPSPAIIPQSPVVPQEPVQANIVPVAPESNIVPVPAEPEVAQVQNSEPAELPSEIPAEEPVKKPIVLPRVG